MTDVFRAQYRELTPIEHRDVDNVKYRAAELYREFDHPLAPGEDAQRHLALARTKLEEAVFWAVKGITG